MSGTGEGVGSLEGVRVSVAANYVCLVQVRGLEGVREEILNHLHSTENQLKEVKEAMASLEEGLGARKVELTEMEKGLKVRFGGRREGVIDIPFFSP